MRPPHVRGFEDQHIADALILRQSDHAIAKRPDDLLHLFDG